MVAGTRSLYVYRVKTNELDVLLAKQKYLNISTVLQVDSEVTRSKNKIVFFAHDEKHRYKVTTRTEVGITFLDCIAVTGRISQPQIQSNKKDTETVYVFPYRQYLAKDDVYVLLQINSIEQSNMCAETTPYQKLRLYFINLKNKLTEIFLVEYEQPYAGLVAGVLIAGKGLMSADVLEMFKRTSLSHVVVLSGSNVSLILVCIKLLVDMLFFWNRVESVFVTWMKKTIILLAICAFVLLTGGGAPIYRAAASAFCGLILFDNKTSQLYALTVVVFILTVINPFQTLFDPSFHLTCCATYGLIIFSKSFHEYITLSIFRFMPKVLREIIAVTLATQVFVFPYILSMTGSFSTVFLLSNVLVLPLIPFIMFSGCITMLGALCNLAWLVDLSVLVNSMFLKFCFWIVQKLADVPYGYVEVSKRVVIVILVLYSVLVLWILHKIQKGGVH